MYTRPSKDMFIDSLSICGRDGTLKRRLRDEFEGCVRGKTGYLRGVRTLSGYVINHQGHWLAVSLLVNDFTGSSRPFTRMQDDVCRLLVQADLPLPAEAVP
jgi:D-alanyl-D-alanine carboxypeptidase/D-alanyl-D-alanine-endopeptidase (penicillin-binding protein 4)